MRDAPRRRLPREGPTKCLRSSGEEDMARRPPRWPAAANAARQAALANQERIAQIARELLHLDEVRRSDRARALVYEALALAEHTRRELGEARPG